MSILLMSSNVTSNCCVVAFQAFTVPVCDDKVLPATNEPVISFNIK